MTIERSLNIRIPANGCKAVWPEAGLDRSAASKTRIYLPSPRKKMIMTLEARDKLMSLTDVSEMLGIPVHTLYR